MLPEPPTGRETYCQRCAPKRRVYVRFKLTNSWCCQFLEPDVKTSAGRHLTFASAAKVRELYDRSGCDKKLEDRQALEHAIEIGNGAMWIEITEDQYRKLKR
jgi:hypothetical protein